MKVNGLIAKNAAGDRFADPGPAAGCGLRLAPGAVASARRSLAAPVELPPESWQAP